MNKTEKYIKNDKKVFEKKFRLKVKFEKSKHLKTTLSDGDISHQIISPLTPSDWRGRRNQITTIRKVLLEKFNRHSKSSDFSIEYARFIKD